MLLMNLGGACGQENVVEVMSRHLTLRTTTAMLNSSEQVAKLSQLLTFSHPTGRQGQRLHSSTDKTAFQKEHSLCYPPPSLPLSSLFSLSSLSLSVFSVFVLSLALRNQGPRALLTICSPPHCGVITYTQALSLPRGRAGYGSGQWALGTGAGGSRGGQGEEQEESKGSPAVDE